jgi:hypothetical protein
MEEPLEIERWKRISVLGSGAFGIVTLWQHTISDDYIGKKVINEIHNSSLIDCSHKEM